MRVRRLTPIGVGGCERQPAVRISRVGSATHKHVRRRPPPTTGDLAPSTHLRLPPTQRGRVTRLWTRPRAGPYAAGRRCERGRVEFDGRRARRLRTPRPRCRHQPGQPSVNRKRQIAPLSVRGDWPGCHSDALSIPSLGFAVAGFANGGPASPRLLRDLRRHILAHDAGLQQTDAVPDTYTIALRTAESVVGPTTPGRVSCTSNIDRRRAAPVASRTPTPEPGRYQPPPGPDITLVPLDSHRLIINDPKLGAHGHPVDILATPTAPSRPSAGTSDSAHATPTPRTPRYGNREAGSSSTAPALPPAVADAAAQDVRCGSRTSESGCGLRLLGGSGSRIRTRVDGGSRGGPVARPGHCDPARAARFGARGRS